MLPLCDDIVQINDIVVFGPVNTAASKFPFSLLKVMSTSALPTCGFCILVVSEAPAVVDSVFLCFAPLITLAGVDVVPAFVAKHTAASRFGGSLFGVVPACPFIQLSAYALRLSRYAGACGRRHSWWRLSNVLLPWKGWPRMTLIRPIWRGNGRLMML